ncbi:unnamed protein product [Bursaphelenchus okinawaensis]|uniref:Uncharacterized protein n=1 Tax=Bursaphelenchus okinawaensis TaxID=465554 RepID=A0A811LPP9_9BILA|nr:unnamed protein product [Bursaphelenchus okinawaensis]CAG9126589.1 unnamed protein product [Bursaphelenchus okinawaensis]
MVLEEEVASGNLRSTKKNWTKGRTCLSKEKMENGRRRRPEGDRTNHGDEVDRSGPPSRSPPVPDSSRDAH